MARNKRIVYLVMQEFKLARRSRYMMLTFIILPFIMWGFQGGIQYFLITEIEGQDDEFAPFEGENMYFMNTDLGNNSLNFGSILKTNLTSLQHNRSSRLYQIRINNIVSVEQNRSDLEERIIEKRISPLVYISANFTRNLLNYNQSEDLLPPIVEIYYLPEDQRFGEAILTTISEVISQSPYRQVDIIKETDFQVEIVTYEGEESAGSTFFTGFIGLIVIMLAVMAPGPYVSSSFAGEKEKGTLESLISLPMKRFDILVSKLIAGMGLVTIFSVMNLIGLMLYQFIVQQASNQVGSEVLGTTATLGTSALVSIFLMILLTSFASIGLGICIASLISDTRTAESVYTFAMLIPAMFVGMTALYGSLPDGFGLMLLIPWTHSILVLYKGLFPQTYADYTLTSGIFMDLMLHIGYLVLFVTVSLYVASRLFDRESLIK